MTTITFLGGDETGDPAKLQWGRFTFIYGQAVECNDPHIIAKARGNRFFRVNDGGAVVVKPVDLTAEHSATAEPIDAPVIKLDPLAKARAAKAAKKAAVA